MKIAKIIKKVEASSEFKQFKKENPEAFLSSAFFVFDLESRADQQELNYFIPSKKDIAVFSFSDSEIIEKESKLFNEERSEKFHELNLKGLKIDAGDIEKEVRKKLGKEKISNKINKIIAVLQSSDESAGVLWNLTCILEGLVIIRINIDARIGKFLKFEKAGLMDFVKFAKGKK